MSSPAVLTFVTVPIEEARASNRQDCDHYLRLAQLVYDQLAPRINALREAGRHVKIETPEQARYNAYAAFGSAGTSALRYAHSYWQRLKHEYGPRITQEFLQFEYDEKLRREAEQCRQREREQLTREERQQATADINRAMRGEFDIRAHGVGSVGEAVESVEQRESRLQEQIRAHLSELQDSPLADRLADALHRTGRDRTASLELLSREVSAQVADRRRDEALAVELQRIQLDDERGEVLGRLELVSESLPGIGEDCGALAETAAVLRQRASETLDDVRDIEAQVVHLESEQRRLASSKRLFQVVQQEFERRGYKRAVAMQTLTPEDIRTRGGKQVFFANQKDPDVFIEMNVVQNTAQIQVVLARDNASESATRRNISYQRELCEAVDRIQKRLTESSPGSSVTLHELVKPDGRPPVRKELGATKRAKSAQQAASRSMST